MSTFKIQNSEYDRAYTYDGVSYYLLQDAYFDTVGIGGRETHFFLAACVRTDWEDHLDEDGYVQAYQLRWSTLDDWEDLMHSDPDSTDDSEACDWYEPDGVREYFTFCPETGDWG